VGFHWDWLKNIRVGEARIFRLCTTGSEVCCGAGRPSRRQIRSCQCVHHDDVPSQRFASLPWYQCKTVWPRAIPSLRISTLSAFTKPSLTNTACVYHVKRRNIRASPTRIFFFSANRSGIPVLCLSLPLWANAWRAPPATCARGHIIIIIIIIIIIADRPYQQWCKLSGQSSGHLPLRRSASRTFASPNHSTSMDYIAGLKWLEKNNISLILKKRLRIFVEHAATALSPKQGR